MLRHRLREMGLQRKFESQSAGTRASQPGHNPDPRAQRIAQEAGISLGGIRASQVSVKDLQRSDYVLAMDQSVVSDLLTICPPQEQGRISLLMSFAAGSGHDEVPDPYYGNYRGFEEVFRLIEEAVTGLLVRIVEHPQ
jgi:protein-tyrosine phosphatase